MKVFALIAVVAVLSLGVALVASDYPISDQAASIHPRQASLEVAVLREKADGGDRELKVEDASSVDPRQWALLMNLDGSQQETHCIKSVDQKKREVKLSNDLYRNYPQGSKIIQGSVARERGVVARLAQAAGRGSSRLTLDTAREIDALEQVILQSFDGRVREAHCVKTVVGLEVELEEGLRDDYQQNSAVIQGRLIDGKPETESNPCCCTGKRAGRR